MQGREPAEAVEGAKSVEADHAETSAISAPPGEEAVTRSYRQPAEAAPSTPPEAKAKPASESEERYIRRRPERTVETRAPYWSRPPRPRIPVPHPASVVIRRPSPRLVTNPRPAVVRLIGPIPVAIRSPSIRLVRHPHLPIVWSVFPLPVC